MNNAKKPAYTVHFEQIIVSHVDVKMMNAYMMQEMANMNSTTSK